MKLVCYIVVWFCYCTRSVTSVDPMQLENESRENIITAYFNSGMAYSTILHFLAIYHNIHLSIRQLNRILRGMGLYRRGNRSSLNDVITFIQAQLAGSVSCQGYRTVHQLMRDGGFNVNRESVRMVLLELDPEGVAGRTRRRLRRRVYHNPGPNQVWHLDGYDKLKPYGLAIHGAIDGYSRKILWLRVGKSNNNPRIVCSYFYDNVKDAGHTASLIRTDRGSENVTITGLQRFIRRNDTDRHRGHSSFLYGRSTSNQRIEAWWSCFRRQRTNWWINYFRDMVDEGVLNPALGIHRECIRFCFIGIVQTELDETVRLWNNHVIRHNYYAACPSGRPDTLYYAPELTGGRECARIVNPFDLDLGEGYIRRAENVFECSLESIEVFRGLIFEGRRVMPETVNSAKDLFVYLKTELENRNLEI